MKTIRLLAFFMLTLIVVLISCKHDSLIDFSDPTVSIDCDPDTVYFQNDILPMLVSNCAKSGCHDGLGRVDEMAPLTNYETVMSSGYVNPFNANSSKLIEAVTNGEEEFMPPAPNTALNSTQITLLRTWINQGARNNACEGGACDTSAVTYSVQITNILDNYCIGCHNSTTASSGIDLSSYSGVADIAGDGSFLGTVTFEAGYVAMPFGGNMLPECKIDIITIWIENGYLNN